MNKVIIGAIAIVVIGAIGAWYFYTKGPAATTSTSTNNTQTSSSATTTGAITYTSGGFQPTSITVRSGDKVTVTNSSNQGIQFNSNPHPLHTDNLELNIGPIAPGESKTFTVTKAGTWGYHNHLNPNQGGTIIVQ